MSIYYNIKSKIHDESCACELQINWNICAIVKDINLNGYLVQRFSRKLFSPNVIPIKEYQDILYYEAWKIEKGIIKYDDTSNVVCDDRFAIGMPQYDTSSEFKVSLGTKGRYEFTGDVYWIPQNSQLYNIVDKWSEQTVKQANGLKASYTFKELDGESPVFSRDKFVHEWDLSTYDKIYLAIKKKLFKMCHENTDRDRNILESNLSEMLNGEYQNISDRLLSEWEEQWKKPTC